MYDRNVFLKAVFDEDVPQIKNSARELFALDRQGRASYRAIDDIKEALKISLYKDKMKALDAILAERPSNRAKFKALVIAMRRENMKAFRKIANSGVSVKDLSEIAKEAIKFPLFLPELFKRGVDPETRVKPTKDSSRKIPFYDYALMSKCDGDVGKMQSHLAVLTTILGAITAKRAATNAALAEVAGAAPVEKNQGEPALA